MRSSAMGRPIALLRTCGRACLPLLSLLVPGALLQPLPSAAAPWEMTYEQARQLPDPGPLVPYARPVPSPRVSPRPAPQAAAPAPVVGRAEPTPWPGPTDTAPVEPPQARPTAMAATTPSAVPQATPEPAPPAAAATDVPSPRRLARLSSFPLTASATSGPATDAADPAAGGPTASSAPSPSPPSSPDSYRLPPLRVQKVSAPSRYTVPSLAAGIPSGFVANSGQVYVGVFGATSDQLRPEADGAMYVGLGLGDPSRNMAFEVDWNIGSMRDFNRNGSLDVKLGRYLYQDANNVFGFQVGLLGAAQYGPEQDVPANFAGAVSWVTRLSPSGGENDKLLMFTVGAGGNRFGYGETGTEGVFAGVGLKVLPNLGLSTAWSGRGANVMAAYVPFRNFPLQLVLAAGDVFNQTPAGAVGILGFTLGRQVLPSF